MQFGTILDALEDNSFMIFYAHSGMNERNSSLEVFLRIWHNLTVKYRDLKEKNCRLQKRDTTHEPPIRRNRPTGDHLWSKNLIVTRLDDQPSNATGSQPWSLFPKGRSQWVTRVISTSGDSHMSHLHFWFTCSCLHFALDVVPKPVSPPQVCSLCQKPRHHEKKQKTWSKYIKININSNIKINIEFDSGLTHKGCRGNSKSICAPQIRLSR